MTVRVPRTCRELREVKGPGSGVEMGESRPLSEFRSVPAYVLLGDPGAGKTFEFDREQEALGDDAAQVVSARDFRTFDLDSRPKWRNKTLFIDGLDETRAGSTNSHTPLDEIRAKLARLGTPSFRLSCREADWLGSDDRKHLRAVSPDSEVTVLRLDPLDADGVDELLRSKYQIDDVEEFVRKAHLNDVGAMLGNPLTLELLAQVARQGGDWPRSRQEIMDRACRLLAAEHRAVRSDMPREIVMDATGYLCALMLFAGTDACSTSVHNGGLELVYLNELRDPPDGLVRDDLEHALTTKLFTAVDMTETEGAFAPRHRQVAEFLAGRYLARRIEAGLPGRRVAALMTGPSDGRVVTALRGLSAWLAAHSREARSHLIAADPVGVGLYGDIERFDLDEQRHLLEALPGALMLDDAYRHETAWAFRSLASAPMVPALRKVLGWVRNGVGDEARAAGSWRVTDGEREIGDDRVAALILGALRHAEPPSAVADLVPELVATVRDDAVPAPLRRRALSAFLHISADRDDREGTLASLLDAIDAGSVSDPDDDLRGILLIELYPEVVGPSDVWRHIAARSQDDYFGRLRAFAKRVLLERSRERHLAELLDTLHEHAAELVPALIESRMGDLPLRVLEEALSVHGENVELARLAGWLAVANRSLSYNDQSSSAGIRAWLEGHPQIQKAVYLESLRSHGPDDDAGTHPFWHFWHSDVLHGSQLPPDFGLWCLDQAVALVDTDSAVSLVLLSHAHASREDPSLSEGLTVETMRERTRGHPALERRLDELQQPDPDPPPSDEHRTEIEEHRRRRDEERRQQREEWAEALREHQAELRENRFTPPNLHSLAMTYLGMFADDDENASPRQRVSDFIGGDAQLVTAVTAALRGAVLRDDVPSADETISLHSQSRHSWMAYPVLASLHLLDFKDPARLDGLDDTRKRDVLAIYYCVAEHDDYGQLWHSRDSQDPLEVLSQPQPPCDPHWYVRWLQHDPDLVLEVLCECALAGVRSGDRFPPGIDALDAIAGHESLVHGVRLKLLKAFPARNSNEQMALLDSLLTNALDHPDKTELLAFARHKQQLKSVPIAQRIRWWATDALISQGDRLQQLRPDLVESETRVEHLARFLRSLWDRHDRRRSILADITDPATLNEMIGILGHWCDAPLHPRGHYTLKIDTSELIDSLIRQLAAVAGDEARQALAGLAADPHLTGWRGRLAVAQKRQQVIHREASYRHPSVQEVQATLNDLAPANAADLAALVGDRLADLSDEVRGGNANLWSQFWNLDTTNGQPTEPRPENACRDTLLATLRERLVLGERLPVKVNMSPEAAYVSGWRADIRAEGRDFNVPIEIKRNSHRGLWRALRAQLIGQYTTGPATSGYGIYVVLWFEVDDTPRPPDGNRPSTPEELGQRLTQDLTEDERRKISVIVIDVTEDHQRLGTEAVPRACGGPCTGRTPDQRRDPSAGIDVDVDQSLGSSAYRATATAGPGGRVGSGS